MTAPDEAGHNLGYSSIKKYILRGAGIALLLAGMFVGVLFTVGGVIRGKSFLQIVWEFFPLLTMTVGGAIGGMIYYFTVIASKPIGWKKTVAVVAGILVYCLILWLSLIAGLSATGQWD